MDSAYIGMIVPWPLAWAPRNWAFCNGAVLAISTNAALFSVLGTQYGGNGTTNFALPNLLGQLPLGVPDSYIPGDEINDSNSSFTSAGMITNANLPPHQHPVTAALASVTGETVLQAGTATTGGQTTPANNSVLTGTRQNVAAAAIYVPAATPDAVKVSLGGVSTVSAGGTGPGVVGLNSVGQTTALLTSHNTSVVAANSLAVNYIICVYGEYPVRN